MIDSYIALLRNSSTPALDVRVLRAHAKDEAELAAWVARRSTGEPVAQIVGSKGFWTLELRVTCDVLTPRPDTETILDVLLKLRPRKDAALRILDLGTGSGCLILAALSEYLHATGDAVDVSASALKVATENAQQTGVNTAAKQRVHFFQGSWCEPLPEGAMYDVVLSNPPYIPTAEIEGLADDVKRFEPMLALDGGADGLDCYRTLAIAMQTRMVSGAIALLEVGAGQANDVAAIMTQSGLGVISVVNDLACIPRVVVVEKQG